MVSILNFKKYLIFFWSIQLGFLFNCIDSSSNTPDFSERRVCLNYKRGIQAFDYRLERLFPKLDLPPYLIQLSMPPSDDSHWYGLTLDGKIIRFANSPDAFSYEVFIDIKDEVNFKTVYCCQLTERNEYM